MHIMTKSMEYYMTSSKPETLSTVQPQLLSQLCGTYTKSHSTLPNITLKCTGNKALYHRSNNDTLHSSKRLALVEGKTDLVTFLTCWLTKSQKCSLRDIPLD